jgi:sialate O-acetylesterase
VAAVDLELDDLIHADTEGLKAIGRRAAMLAGIDLFADALPFKHLKPGPDIVEAVLDGGNKRIVRVRCDGVNGKLVAAGKPWGFSCSVGGNETAAPQPFKIQFDPDDPESVLLLFQDETPPDLQLWYGRGLNPYCNIGDEAGLGLLAAGPIMISGP